MTTSNYSVHREMKYIFKLFQIFGLHNFGINKLDAQPNNQTQRKTSAISLVLLILRIVFLILSIIHTLMYGRDRSNFTNFLVAFMQLAGDILFPVGTIWTTLKLFYSKYYLMKFYKQINLITKTLSNEFTLANGYSNVKKQISIKICGVLILQFFVTVLTAVKKKDILFIITQISLNFAQITNIFSTFLFELTNVTLSLLHQSLLKFCMNSRNVSLYEAKLLNISEKGLCQIKRRKLKVIAQMFALVQDNMSISNDLTGFSLLVTIIILTLAQVLSGYKMFMMLSDENGLSNMPCELSFFHFSS